PPTSSAPTSSYSFRSRNKSKLVYDAKYHPMDDAIRPTQAARRRSAHGENQFCLDADDESEDYAAVYTNAEELDDEESEAEEEPRQGAKNKKRKLTQSRLMSVEPTRRSPRKVSDQRVSYNMNVHPQDEFLEVSSEEEEVVVKKKSKRSKRLHVDDMYSDDGVVVSKSAQRRYSDYVDNTTSDEMEFDGGDAVARTEVDSDDGLITIAGNSITSPVVADPQNGIKRKDSIDSLHLSPGRRCFRHDKDAWPVSSGQPFTIFNEKLAYQLAREAHTASPLNYEHDDKENVTDNDNIDVNPLSSSTAGVSIIPEAQYMPTSEDCELSNHRALINYALYDDPHPQTYGLDGTHCSGTGEGDVFSESMNILASGRGLPLGKSAE
ncbi:hypothetical protein COCMIDRAFT_103898, partial [Bipolaris oryzae ATCC 44560]